MKTDKKIEEILRKDFSEKIMFGEEDTVNTELFYWLELPELVKHIKENYTPNTEVQKAVEEASNVQVDMHGRLKTDEEEVQKQVEEAVRGFVDCIEEVAGKNSWIPLKGWAETYLKEIE